MLITAMMMAAALGASEPDGVVATAPATSVDLNVTTQPVAPSVEGVVQSAVPHNLTTDEQIERWLKSRSPADTAWHEAAAEPLDDRKMHGEVSFGIGTGGYRNYGAAVSLPLGENGRLDLQYRQVENGYPYGLYGYDDGYGWPYFDDGGYAVPGSRLGAAAAFEARATRHKGPPSEDR